MLPIEAKWIMSAVQSLETDALTPLLNLGSSTRAFREKEQPWIHNYLLSPLSSRGIRILNMDIKQAEGVDIAGDILNDETLSLVSKSGIKAMLCSNLLEHVEHREELCTRLLTVLPAKGYLIVTVPFKYPYHPDPIDTQFRPDVGDLHRLFPDTNLISGKTLDCGAYVLSGKPVISAAIHAARILLPFYKSSQWMDRLKWTFKNVYVTCLVLQKK